MGKGAEMTYYGDLHIIDLGTGRPTNHRYALGTAEPDPFGGPGRWVRVEVEGDSVRHRLHLERIKTCGIDEIIVVTDDDEVTE